MKQLGLNYLMGKQLISINQIVLIDSGEEFILDNTIILEFDKSELVQLLVSDNNIIVSVINTISNALILGEFDEDDRKMNKLRDNINSTISKIRSYSNRVSDYTFGLNLLDENGKSICHFCLGFDEIEYLVESNVFENMLKTYSKEGYVLEELTEGRVGL
jgi:hypothetical protein